MEFKKPTTEKMTHTAAQAVGGVLGGMGSNILVAKVLESLNASEKKLDASKQENNRRLVKGVTAAAAWIAASFVEGKDTTTQAVKGALYGVALTQTLATVREFIDAKTDTNATLKQAVGLNCPCQNTGLNFAPRVVRYTPFYHQDAIPADFSVERKNLLENFKPEKKQFYN